MNAQADNGGMQALRHELGLSLQAFDALMSEAVREFAARREANKPVTAAYTLPTVEDMSHEQRREYSLSVLAWRDIAGRMTYLRRNIDDLTGKPEYDTTRFAQLAELAEHEQLITQLMAARDTGEISTLEYEALVVPGHELSPEAARVRRELRELRWFYQPRQFMVFDDGMRYVLNVRDSRRPGRTGTVYLKRDTSGAWYKMLRLPEAPGVLDDHGVFWPDDELLRGSGGGLQWT